MPARPRTSSFPVIATRAICYADAFENQQLTRLYNVRFWAAFAVL